MIRCPPSNTLASSIFLSPERVTLSPACVHTLLSPPPSTSLHLPLPPQQHNPGTSMACSFDGPPWNKNTRCLLKSLLYPRRTKRRLHLRTVPTIRPWPPRPPPAHSPTGSFQRGAAGVWATPFMFACVRAGLLCQTLPPFTKDVQRDWPAAFDAATPPPPPIQIWKTHLHLYVCGVHS